MRSLQVDSADGQTFLSKFFPNAVIHEVPMTANMQETQCYSNVRSLVAKRGGASVWGWVLREVPGQYIEAMHHALWRNAQGDLEDVTSVAATGFKGSTSLFVIDDSLSPNDYDPAVPSKFMQTCESTNIGSWIDLNRKRMRIRSEMTDLIKSIRHKITPKGIAALEKPPAKLQTLQNKLAAIDAELFRIDKKLRAGDLS